MALPKSYLTSSKNLAGILDAIKGAQAPDTFTIRFLEALDYKSNHDRLVIGVLVALGFLSSDKKPTERYFAFLDQTQSDALLAEGIRSAYADLFQINSKAHTMSKPEVIGKLKTLSQGAYSTSVLDKMALTFVDLCKLADFTSKPKLPDSEHENDEGQVEIPIEQPGETIHQKSNNSVELGGLHYNIQIILPESRDPRVYDVLFKSLKEHLL